MAAAEGAYRPSTASLCAGFLRKLFAVVAFVEIDFGQASFCPSMLAAAFWVSRRSAVASHCCLSSLLKWEEKASMGSETQPVRLFAQDKKVQHSSTALRNVLADKEQTQSKLGATLAAMEDEMAEREAGWEAERGGLQAMLAAKERELVRSHCLLPGFCARSS